MLSCGCYCCRKPRYKRLVDTLYPDDPQDTTPVAAHLDKLLYFARSSPEHLDRMGDYLATRLRRSLTRDRRGHVCVSLKIIEKLLTECDSQRLQLITDSYLSMLHSMLESTDPDFQIMATDSFVMFSERDEQTTPYHRQYDFFIHRFTAMSLVRTSETSHSYLQIRKAGLRGLGGVIKKTEGDESLQLNIWTPDDLNKIIPPFLFNMLPGVAGDWRAEQGAGSAAEESLGGLAEEGLKSIVSSAGLAHIDSVFIPVLQHFDLNHIWTEKKEFGVDVFITIIKTMQKQYRYKAIQALVGHLDKKVGERCLLKQGILDTLSHCVSVAADGSLGPSVLDVFRTLVRHLRISIEDCSTSVEASTNGAFQDSLTKTMGEFAGVLPDYHKPDIMTLITSYMDTGGGGANRAAIKRQKSCSSNAVLRVSLVKAMRSIAETYRHNVLETALPEALFASLVELLRVTQHETQLDVCLLWHQLIDHHNNKQNIPLHTRWESLATCNLSLGRVSQHFINQTRGSLYSSLVFLATHLSPDHVTILAYYHLLALLSLEFAQLGVSDMIHLVNKLQDTALDTTSQISSRHRVVLHGISAGILSLLSHISSLTTLRDHVAEVVERRREKAPSLLPDTLFKERGGEGREEEEEGQEEYPDISEDLMFQLRELGLVRQSPEPAVDLNTRRGHLMRESSTTSNDFLPHASLSLDYGSDSPLGNEQINFNSFKNESAFDESPTNEMREGLGPSLTYEQQVGLSSRQETGLGGIAHLVQSASKPVSEAPTNLRITSAYDMEIPSLN